MKCLKKTLLFFSCFAWTQHLLSLSTLSLLQNINKERIVKRKNTESLSQSTPNDKKPKQPSQYKCDICKQALSSKESLARHLSENVCQRNYTCTIPPCWGNDHFISQKELSDHMHAYKEKHVFQCDFNNCKITLCDQYALNKHKKRHVLGEHILCSICSKRYPSKIDLAQHKRKKHNPKNEFKCQVCKFTYVNKDLLEKHYKKHIKPFSCFFCVFDQTYDSQNALNTHTMRNHAYSQCKYCNKCFILGSLLLSHSNEQHGFLSISCSECPRHFYGLLNFYQHQYMQHKKRDKDAFIKFLQDFIEKNLSCSYPFYQDHPFFYALFLEKEVLRETLLLNLEEKSQSEIPIETRHLYKQFIEKIKSIEILHFKQLSLNVLLSYECYRLYLSYDSAIWLLFLKEILSIMIENRKPLETTYKEMLDRLYRKQFTDEEYDLFMLQFKKIFFEKITILEQSIIYKKEFSSSGTLQSYEKDGLKTERLVDLNSSFQESSNPKQWDNQSGVPKEYLLPHEQVGIGGVFPSVNTVFKKNADTIVGSPVAKTSEYDFNNIENDLNNLNDSHQGNPFSFEENHEVRTPYNVIGRQA